MENDHPLDGRGDQIQDDKVIFPRNPWLDHGPSLSGEVVSSSPNDFEIGSRHAHPAKVVVHQSYGAIPSISVAAASLLPLSGNRQRWNSYAMAHVSWFLLTPEDSTDPYDNDVAIHINVGTKSQYDAGPATYRSRTYLKII
jgi:hypothetical protein